MMKKMMDKINNTLYYVIDVELAAFLLVSAFLAFKMILPLFKAGNIIEGTILMLIAAGVIISGLVCLVKEVYHDWCTDHHVGEKTREIFEKFSAITDAMAEKANIVMCHVLDMEIVMLAVVSIGGIVWMTMPLFKMGLVGIIFGLALIIVVVIMSAVCLHSWFSGEEK